MESLIFLDTHAVVWLYAGDLGLFSKKLLKKIEEGRVCISHMVKLEMKFLHEIGRIKHTPDVIIDALTDEIGLTFSKNNFDRIINQAVHFDFTCDPFDRIIIADASISNAFLVSKDETIQKYYKNTIW